MNAEKAQVYAWPAMDAENAPSASITQSPSIRFTPIFQHESNLGFREDYQPAPPQTLETPPDNKYELGFKDGRLQATEASEKVIKQLTEEIQTLKSSHAALAFAHQALTDNLSTISAGLVQNILEELQGRPISLTPNDWRNVIELLATRLRNPASARIVAHPELSPSPAQPNDSPLVEAGIGIEFDSALPRNEIHALEDEQRFVLSLQDVVQELSAILANTPDAASKDSFDA